MALYGAIDPALADSAAEIPDGVVTAFFVLNLLGPAATAYALLQYFVRAREAALADLAREHRALGRERARSERLLLNVLPGPIAERLKASESVIADLRPEVTVLFADLVGFTPLADRLPASKVVSLLDGVFGRWDALAAARGVEKIKTIGDAYMPAAGIPLPREDHAEAIAELALAMGPELARSASEAEIPLELRIGIDSGPVVAGVIGRAKFSYDLWGDTVNTASRMEASAEPGTIQVTARVRERLRDRYAFSERGAIDVKGKGEMRGLSPRGSSPGRRRASPRLRRERDSRQRRRYPMPTRTASARWDGPFNRGSGTMSLQSGAFEGAYSAASRFEEGEGSNPEELIAAAHAGCFSMAFALILGEAGHEPESIATEADVHVTPAEGGGYEISRIDLRTRGRVPGIDAEEFRKHAEAAKAGCPVSKALAGVGEINLDAQLEG